MAKNHIPVKILVAVGDSQCGKSALLYKFAKDQFLEGYLPTLFENYAAEVESSQGVVQVSMFDTPGDDNFSHLRPLSYTNSDVVLLCFDLSDTTSYRNLFHKWIPELKEYCHHIPFAIVGCKSDINLEPRKHTDYVVSELTPSNHSEVSQLLHHSGAIDYFTCSAKTGDNLTKIFSVAVEATFQRSKRCSRRIRSVSSVSLGLESKVLFGSGLRRRAFTDIPTNQKESALTVEGSSCFPAFHCRRHVASEPDYYENQQASCSIL